MGWRGFQMEMDDSSGLKFEFQGFRLLPMKPPRAYARGILHFFGAIRRSTLLRSPSFGGSPLRIHPWTYVHGLLRRRIKCSAERLQLSPNLASFAPWNTDSTKVELFARSAIPPGESLFIRSLNPNSTENFKYVWFDF